MELEYRVIRSNRRTMALEVTREGELLVRVPRRVSEKTIAEFVQAHEDWASRGLETMRQRALAHPEPDETERAALIERAKHVLPLRVGYFAGLMGLRPTGIRITSARTRFGSCSARNSLCFSWRLMQYPPAAVDYVVVHELAHIVHKNHGKEFYALVAAVLPDYKQRIELLKR